MVAEPWAGPPAGAPDYLFGECIAFALAARRVLGWPLVVFSECDPTAVDVGPVHAAVAHPGGGFFDASGPVVEQAVVERYGIQRLEVVRHPVCIDEGAFVEFATAAEVDRAAGSLAERFGGLPESAMKQDAIL